MLPNLKKNLFKGGYDEIVGLLGKLRSQTEKCYVSLRKYVETLRRFDSLESFLDEMKIKRTERIFREKFLRRTGEWYTTLSKISYRDRFYNLMFLPLISRGYKVIFNERNRVIEFVSPK